MSAPKGADITDAVTRSAIVLLFKQFVLATPKTRSLTITIGDIKITSPPVQHTHWQAARGQPDPRRFSSGQQQGHRVHNAKQRRSANRAAERAGQPPPYPKPSTAKDEQAPHPGGDSKLSYSKGRTLGCFCLQTRPSYIYYRGGLERP